MDVRELLHSNKDKTDVEQFIRKAETLFASLDETKKDNYGFFCEYYAPYFIEMKKKGFVETFGYISFASSDNPEVMSWLKANKDKITPFFEWSTAFNWKTK